MGVALMRGKFGDVHDLKMDLLRLIEQMDPDTRKAFKQRLYLGGAVRPGIGHTTKRCR